MPQYKYSTKAGIKWLVKVRYFNPITKSNAVEYKRGFSSKREAKQYEEDFLEQLESSGIETPPEKKTFEDVYKEYLASHKREDLKESSLRTKTTIFENHIFPTFKDMPIREITADLIAEWQSDMKSKTTLHGKKISNSFLRTVQSQFNSVINYAHDKGYLICNPLADIKNMGIKDKRVVFWTLEEYERFSYCAMNYPDCYYAFEVLYWCGIREGELLALTLEDINLDNATISITKTYQRINQRDVITTPKTPSSVRTVSMPAFLVDELREYIAMLYDPRPNQRIFAITKSKLCKSFKTITIEAGLKHIPIHGLRHSHVSLLINKKYDIFEISKRIGHKSIKTTQDTYGHLFDAVQKTIANDLDNMRR